MSTSESFSKAMDIEVEVKISIEDALIPSAFTVSLIFTYAYSWSKTFSASAIPFARAVTAALAWLPIEVSWQSIIQSTPSRVEAVISVSSCLYGSGLLIICSSNYDWRKIGLALAFIYWIAHFCAIVNFSAVNSQASSFLTKITPSACF